MTIDKDVEDWLEKDLKSVPIFSKRDIDVRKEYIITYSNNGEEIVTFKLYIDVVEKRKEGQCIKKMT